MGTRRRQRHRSESRRRFPRWAVVGGRLRGPMVTARVLDLSPAGAHIETSRPLRVGAPYTFTLELPGSHRRLSGRVCWCRLVATRSAAGGDRTAVYRAGIVFGPGPGGASRRQSR